MVTMSNAFQIVVLNLLFLAIISALHVNITSFDNCNDHDDIVNKFEHAVTLTSVERHYVNGLCDTVSGSYLIRKTDTARLEISILMFKCPLESYGACTENKLEFTESVDCTRFTTDPSGPWYMISLAMSDSKCGQKVGEFSLSNAKLKLEYLQNYIHDYTHDSRHRLRMLFSKVHPEWKYVRGCIDIEFYLLAK